ncbi:hypothetical protein [Pseudopedobacter beijingensis]|uniref:Lipoprotein n=1 Tax=Pseudopedobacter beijingensis TaxID=1207056 RepID=A0ABW4I9W2_9SPHI
MKQYLGFSFMSFAILCMWSFYACSAAVKSDLEFLKKDEPHQKEKLGKLLKTKTSMSIYTANGIEFTFRNVKKDYQQGITSFYDIWQLWEAFGRNEKGEREANIIRPGEWETALKINNDFVGGINHGFERKTAIRFVLDGEIVPESESITLQSFKNLYVEQESDLYAFNSTMDKIAVITKKWDFNTGGEIKFYQTIKWLSEQTLSNSYLTMLPVARDDKDMIITSKAKRDDLHEVFDVSYEGHKNPLGPAGRNKEASVMILWGDTYRFTVSVKRKEILPNSSLWLSNSKLYNKIYFDYSGKHTVDKGDVFNVLTIFKIDRITPES